MTKRKTNEAGKGSKDGVALIIVLGLLSVLTLLAVAFAIAMRVERLAARNYANLVRAKQLVQVALIRSMDHVDLATAGMCFPAWTNVEPASVRDALCSLEYPNAVECTDLLTGEALSFIPGAVRDDAETLGGTPCYVHWTNIVDQNEITNGRIAYLVANCSGLMDVHHIGNAPDRTWSTNINEIDISSLPDIVQPMPTRDTDPDGYLGHDFFENRDSRDVRYETVREFEVLNDGVIDGSSNLFVFSYDPGRDVLFEDRAELGMRNAALTNKFYLHSITNYACYNSLEKDAYRADPEFMTEYYERLVGYLEGTELRGPENSAKLWRAEDVAWNIINYLDTNRVPQTGADGDYPWRHTEGGEPVPLINEIVLRKAENEGANSNRYEFVVEFWFPFYPVDVQPEDRFSYQIAVFSNNWAGVAAPSPHDIMLSGDSTKGNPHPDWSFSGPIFEMGVGNPFMCVTSPVDKKIFFEDIDGSSTNYVQLGGTDSKGKKCSVWFLARIFKADTIGGTLTTNICDESMGYDAPEEQAQSPHRRSLLEFDSLVGYSVNDPRSNGQKRYWGASPDLDLNKDGEKYPAEDHTLGGMNDISNPWTRKGQGVPIFYRNDLMKSIGELGHVFGSNIDDEVDDPEDYWWQTINLLCYDQGAFLLDRLTIRPTNLPERGLVNISTTQREVLYALLHRARIGTNNWYRLNKDDPDELDACVDALIANAPYVSFADMFPEDTWHGGPVGDGFIGCSPTESLANEAHTNDILREGSFRSIIDLISFRQNLFTVVVAAQVYGKDQKSVVAEKRGVAIVYRDSYTGRSFVRSFKWLTD